MGSKRVALATVLVGVYWTSLLSAQPSPGAGQPPTPTGVRTIDGPAAPIPPEVITRDEAGRATVRAVKLTEPLALDGELDEAIYGRVPPISGFIQQLPDEGAPATERTEVGTV